jgi:AcrR family transcriptional regulator
MGRRKRISDEALLAAAREVFVAEGFGGSTRAIARRAGVSEAVLFQRPRTQLDLFFAAMVPPPLDLAHLVVGAGHDQGAGRGLEAIALEVMAYFRGIMPVLMQLVTHPSFSLTELAARHADMPLHGLAAAVAGYLKEQRRRHAIDASARDIDLAVLTLVAALHSLALFERMGMHGGVMADEVVRGVARVAAASLKVTQGATPKGGQR